MRRDCLSCYINGEVYWYVDCLKLSCTVISTLQHDMFSIGQDQDLLLISFAPNRWQSRPMCPGAGFVSYQ